MVNSVGVDLVQVSEVQRLLDTFGDAFIDDNFSKAEASHARTAPNPALFLAARFAAKEAAYKALAHFTRSKDFDLKLIETLDEPDGYPLIHVSPVLQALLDEAGITALHVSLAHQGDFALAFVIAEKA